MSIAQPNNIRRSSLWGIVLGGGGEGIVLGVLASIGAYFGLFALAPDIFGSPSPNSLHWLNEIAAPLAGICTFALVGVVKHVREVIAKKQWRYFSDMKWGAIVGLGTNVTLSNNLVLSNNVVLSNLDTAILAILAGLCTLIFLVAKRVIRAKNIKTQLERERRLYARIRG